MPISQERVIALIDAAIDYKEAFEKLVSHVKEYASMLEESKHSVDTSKFVAAQLLLYVAAPEQYLKAPLQTEMTIRLEHDHFHRNFRYNIRSAQRMRAHRTNRTRNQTLLDSSVPLTRFNLPTPEPQSQPAHLASPDICSTCQFPISYTGGGPEFICGMPVEVDLACPHDKKRILQELLILYFNEDFPNQQLPPMLNMSFSSPPNKDEMP